MSVRVYLWRVKFIHYTNFGNLNTKEEEEGLFVTRFRDLDEIENHADLAHYERFHILSAEYLGEGNLVESNGKD